VTFEVIPESSKHSAIVQYVSINKAKHMMEILSLSRGQFILFFLELA